MNILLFVPFGLTLPFALPDKCTKKIITTILTACIFSIIIEAVQYFFQLGRCETDDVIMNTFGAAIGSLPCVVSKQILIIFDNRKKK